jgi:hypothetical protein
MFNSVIELVSCKKDNFPKKILLTSRKINYFIISFLKRLMKINHQALVFYDLDFNKISDFNKIDNFNLFFDYEKTILVNSFIINYDEKIESEKVLNFLKQNDFCFGHVNYYLAKEIEKNGFKVFNTDIFLRRDNFEVLKNFYESELQFHILSLINDFENISLEDFMRFASYALFIRKEHWGDFIKELKLIHISSAYSLYDLSTFFFSKKYSEFFICWNSIKNDYSEEFWFSYWINQIWEAYLFVLNTNNGNNKSIYNKKLPRWFVSSGYKQYSFIDFYDYFIFLYKQDQISKTNGIDFLILLEGFFIKWFFNKDYFK